MHVIVNCIYNQSLFQELMKHRNISFAQVLKKNVRSPQLEKNEKNMSLLDIFMQYEQNPDEDYALYLGKPSLSHKSKQQSIRMFMSKNLASNQEEMFDSWIQRQSHVSHNKENISNQPRKIQTNMEKHPVEPLKQKNINSLFSQTMKIPPKRMADIVVHANQGQTSKNRNNTQYTNPITHPNIEMIKSNYSESEQIVQIQPIRKVQHKKTQQINLQFDKTQYIKINPPINRNPNDVKSFKTSFKQGNNNYKRQMDKITTQKDQQIGEVINIVKPNHNFIQMPSFNSFKNMNGKSFNSMINSNQSQNIKMINSKALREMEEIQNHKIFPLETKEEAKNLMSNAQHIEDDISDIANKYLFQKQDEDEELLIDNSNKKDDQIDINNNENEYFLNETYKKTAKEQQQLQKKRLQQAKALLGTYVKAITKCKNKNNEENYIKEQTQNHKYFINDNYSKQKQYKHEDHSPTNGVGYSFSSNMPQNISNTAQNNTFMSFAQQYSIPKNQQEIGHYHQENIPIDSSHDRDLDMQFTKKYLNVQNSYYDEAADFRQSKSLMQSKYEQMNNNTIQIQKYGKIDLNHHKIDDQQINSSQSNQNKSIKDSFLRRYTSQKQQIIQSDVNVNYQHEKKQQQFLISKQNYPFNSSFVKQHNFINPFQKQSSPTEVLEQRPLKKSKGSDNKLQRKSSNRKLTVYSSKMKSSPQTVQQAIEKQQGQIKTTPFAIQKQPTTTKSQSISNIVSQQQYYLSVNQQILKKNDPLPLQNNIGSNFVDSMSKNNIFQARQIKVNPPNDNQKQKTHAPFSTKINLSQLKQQTRKYQVYSQKYAIPAPISIYNYQQQQRSSIKGQYISPIQSANYSSFNKPHYNIADSSTQIKQHQSREIINPAFQINSSLIQSSEFQFDL